MAEEVKVRLIYFDPTKLGNNPKTPIFLGITPKDTGVRQALKIEPDPKPNIFKVEFYDEISQHPDWQNLLSQGALRVSVIKTAKLKTKKEEFIPQKQEFESEAEHPERTARKPKS